MKILHTVGFYPPAHGGGATHVVRRVSEGLAKRGHDVTVATAYHARRSPGIPLNGVMIEQFDIKSYLGQSVLGISGEVDRFVAYLCTQRFDIVMNYAAQTWHADLTFGNLGKISGQVVLAACGYSGLIGWRRIIYRSYFKRLPQFLRKYDGVIYHASGYLDWEFGKMHAIAHSTVIPNGIDSNEFAVAEINFREFYNIRKGPILITVGDHYRNKGHERVLKAFRSLNRRDDVTLVIIGRAIGGRTSSCINSCRRCARNMDGRVVLLEDAPRSHIVAAYKEASVFLSGSYIEAFPLVILEAMTCSLPFVAFPAGNIAQLPGGIMVTSIDEMANATKKLLSDETYRQELGRAGCAEQRNEYEWEKIVGKYEDYYQRLLREKSEKLK